MNINNIYTLSRIIKNKTLTTFREIAEQYLKESEIDLKNRSITDLSGNNNSSTTRQIQLENSTNTTTV